MELIKKLSGNIIQEEFGHVEAITAVSGNAGLEDYINVWGLTGFIQDLTRAEITERLNKPIQFGLPNTYNIPIVEIKIDY